MRQRGPDRHGGTFRLAGHSPLGTLRLRIPTPRARGIRGRDVLRAVVDRLSTIGRSGQGSPDLLSDLVAGRDEAGGMGRELLRDEVLTLLLAGHETTANWIDIHVVGALGASGSGGPSARGTPRSSATGRQRSPIEIGCRSPSRAPRNAPSVPTRMGGRPSRAFERELGGQRARGRRRLGVPIRHASGPRMWDTPGQFDPDRGSTVAPHDSPWRVLSILRWAATVYR